MSPVSACIFFLLSILCFQCVVSIVPVSCSSGKCQLQNYQGIWYERVPCSVSEVAYPTTEQELVAAVAKGVKNGQKIKVVSKLSHSLVRVACPGGNTGLLISTSKYNSRISINKDKLTVTVDAGVQLQDLIAVLAKQSLALPTIPYFSGLSISGLISTGSHGSSLVGRGGAVHDYVTGISVVVPASSGEGYAKLVKIHGNNADLNAAKLSIGVLGAISQVTLQVESMFKRSVTKQAKDDSNLENEVATFANQHAFGDINWYIAQKKVLLRLDDKVSVSTRGEGRNAGNEPTPASQIRQSRVQEENIMAQMNATLLCAQSATGVESRVTSGDGFVNDNSNTFKGYPVVGYNHLMQVGSGTCQNAALNGTKSSTGEKLTCYWDPDVPGQFYFQTSIAIPLSKIKGAIQDIKKIRDANPQKLCGVSNYGGAQLRFFKGSSAYLAEPEDSVAFELLYYRERRDKTPVFDHDAFEEIEQMLLKKYNGRPHWGKNKNSMFENMGPKVTNLPKFLEVMQRFDPQGHFSSEWSDAVLGIKRNNGTSRGVSVVRDYCALEGLCVCSQDRHCAPEKGFLCKPGSVFTDTRVCRKTT